MIYRVLGRVIKFWGILTLSTLPEGVERGGRSKISRQAIPDVGSIIGKTKVKLFCGSIETTESEKTEECLA